MNSPPVSVIITTYYRDEHLRRAIEWVLDQCYQNIELIVVDDSGEEYAKEIVAEYDSVEYIPHPTNQGQIAGWNTGMNCASGKYIQFHDDDDWLFEDKIQKQVCFLEDNPTIGSVYCGIVDDEGTERLPPEDNRGNVVEPTLRHQLYRCQTTTMLTRRNLLDEVFPLKTYPAATDIVLQLELCTQTEFDYIGEPLVHRSIHGDGIGSSVVNRRTRIQLVHDYGSLYDKYPEIRVETLARCHKMLGETILQERLWSLAAIVAFAKANYYLPKKTIDSIHYLLIFLASIFGRPGLSAYRVVQPYLAQIKKQL